VIKHVPDIHKFAHRITIFAFEFLFLIPSQQVFEIKLRKCLIPLLIISER